MSLVSMIEDLINDIGTGLNESTIKERLLTLLDQAEAQDARLKELEAKVIESESKANLEKHIPDQEGLDDTSVRFLKILFDRPMTLSQVAAALNITKGMAEYHRDVLKEAKMIGKPGIVSTIGRETPYRLLPEGREYLVKNKLV